MQNSKQIHTHTIITPEINKKTKKNDDKSTKQQPVKKKKE